MCIAVIPHQSRNTLEFVNQSYQYTNSKVYPWVYIYVITATITQTSNIFLPLFLQLHRTTSWLVKKSMSCDQDSSKSHFNSLKSRQRCDHLFTLSLFIFIHSIILTMFWHLYCWAGEITNDRLSLPWRILEPSKNIFIQFQFICSLSKKNCYKINFVFIFYAKIKCI